MARHSWRRAILVAEPFVGGRLNTGQSRSTRNRFVKTVFALTLLFASSTVAMADPPHPVDLATLKAKVRVKPEDDFTVTFNRQGDQITNPLRSRKAEMQQSSVHVTLSATSNSPIRPPRDGATRPFLSVQNNFEKSLHFRALVRMKGHKEFVELIEGRTPIPAGENFNKCWGFDTQVEEVVLYEFKLSDETVD